MLETKRPSTSCNMCIDSCSNSCLTLIYDRHYALQCFPSELQNQSSPAGAAKGFATWQGDCHGLTVDWSLNFRHSLELLYMSQRYRKVFNCDAMRSIIQNETRAKIQWSLSHKGNGNRLGMHSIFMEGLLAPWTWPPLVPHPVVEVFIGFHMFFFSNVYFKSFLHHFFSLFAIASVVAPHFFVRFQHLRRAGGTPGSHCAKQKEIETSTAWRQLLEIEMV